MADDNINKVIAKDSLELLVMNGQVPDFWVVGRDRVTYGTLNNIFDVIDSNSLACSCVLQALNILCGRDISNIIKKPSNLRSKILNYIKKNPDCFRQIVPELSLPTVAVSTSLGPFCDELHITSHTLLDAKSFSGSPRILLNGTILELDQARVKFNVMGYFSAVASNSI